MEQAVCRQVLDTDAENTRSQTLARWTVFYRDSLYKYALKHYKDREVAKDIVQDTLLSALKAYDSQAEYKNVRSWLFKILKNKLIDYSRKKRAILASDQDTSETCDAWIEQYSYTMFEDGNFTLNPEAILVQRRFYEKLEHCLSQLPERSRQALEMRVFEGRSAQEVCDTLDISKSNLWVLLHRSRSMLKDALLKKQ